MNNRKKEKLQTDEDSMCSFESRWKLKLFERCFGPVAQLVRAPPCHGGGRGFESHPGRLSKKDSIFFIWDLSSAGRASALQAEGHRFEPYRSHFADVAQLAEQLICNQQVNGSSPFIGSLL